MKTTSCSYITATYTCDINVSTIRANRIPGKDYGPSIGTDSRSAGANLGERSKWHYGIICPRGQFVEDSIREHFGLERISILGSSYGGMVAQGYAIRYPDRIANLVLAATAPSFRFMDDAKRIASPNTKRP